VATATLLDYEAVMAHDNEDINSSLSENQKRLAATHHLLVVNGKNNKNCFIVLDQDMKAAIELIIKRRELGHVEDSNNFIFATGWTQDGFMRHSPILKRYAEELKVKNMSTRAMRKYLATTFQATAPSEQENDFLARHLGNPKYSKKMS